MNNHSPKYDAFLTPQFTEGTGDQLPAHEMKCELSIRRPGIFDNFAAETKIFIYHDCCFPGSVSGQAISSHGIDYAR